MALDLIKEEINKEIETVKHFLELAIKAQECGYTEAAHFFLKEAQENCEHAFSYAKELNKHNKSPKKTTTITNLTKSYYDLELSTIERINQMYHKSKNKNQNSTMPFISKMMNLHSEACFRAKKILHKIEILLSSNTISNIEDLFKESE